MPGTYRTAAQPNAQKLFHHHRYNVQFFIPNIHATARIVEGCGLFAIFQTIPAWSLLIHAGTEDQSSDGAGQDM
ncbi:MULTISPECIES: hypothetical protein [unclassified Paenibacillus]|uniref:hypothetical protein n=1 Tax=unclassified Paenibacillus TaxID=185978 RepID=UPI00383933D0